MDGYWLQGMRNSYNGPCSYNDADFLRGKRSLFNVHKVTIEKHKFLNRWDTVVKLHSHDAFRAAIVCQTIFYYVCPNTKSSAQWPAPSQRGRGDQGLT